MPVFLLVFMFVLYSFDAPAAGTLSQEFQERCPFNKELNMVVCKKEGGRIKVKSIPDQPAIPENGGCGGSSACGNSNATAGDDIKEMRNAIDQKQLEGMPSKQ